MNVEIPCELYSRLTAIPLTLDRNDKRKYLCALYLERKENQLYAVATNVKIATIEYLGINVGPDECTALIVDQALIDQCENEIQFGSVLQIVANPMLGYTSIKTTLAYSYPGNGMVVLPQDNWLQHWREWFPDQMATQSNGAMRWAASSVNALGYASKSGVLTFPEFIDVSFPVVVRDGESNDWVGLFMPSQPNVKTIPATIPEWVR